MSRKAIAHRNALVALARFLGQDRGGAVLRPALKMLVQVLRGRGGLAYRVEGDDLVLHADIDLPMPARPELSRLAREGAWGSVMQRVARSGGLEVDGDLGSALPALEAGGWRALAASPLRLGDKLVGVVAIAAGSPIAFDDETKMFLESVSAMLALALDHEQSQRDQRSQRVDDGKTSQLATLGLVADTVARDLASPLSALESQLDRQHERIQALRGLVEWQVGGDVAAALDAIEIASDDASTMLRQAQAVTSRLLALGRETRHEPIELGHVVRETAHLVASHFQVRRLGLSLQDVDDELWMVGRQESVQLMLVQLMLHFADIAVATWSDGPEVVVRLDRNEEVLLVSLEAVGQGRQLTVAETDALLLEGGGSGSLDLVQRTMRTHDGHIELGAIDEADASIPTVRLVLPAHVEEPRMSTLPTTRPAAPSTPSFLWVVSDVDYAKAVCHEIDSHECFVAGSIAEALTMLMTMPSPELVLCAVALPDGNGTNIHADAPATLQERFVFSTNAILSAEVAQYLRRSGCSTLLEPVGLEEVRRLLDRGEGAVARTLHQDSHPPRESDPDVSLDRLSDPDVSFAATGAPWGAEEELDWSDPSPDVTAHVADDHDDPDEDEANDPGRVTMVEPLEHRAARQSNQRRQAPTPPERS